MARIPPEVKAALMARNAAREALRLAEAALKASLAPHEGEQFKVEGVPFRVCKSSEGPYLRRTVGPDKTRELREQWLHE